MLQILWINFVVYLVQCFELGFYVLFNTVSSKTMHKGFKAQVRYPLNGQSTTKKNRYKRFCLTTQVCLPSMLVLSIKLLCKIKFV